MAMFSAWTALEPHYSQTIPPPATWVAAGPAAMLILGSTFRVSQASIPRYSASNPRSAYSALATNIRAARNKRALTDDGVAAS